MKKKQKPPEIPPNGSHPQPPADAEPPDAPPEMIDLDALFAQVSARLLSIDSIPFSQFEAQPQKPVERVQLAVFSLGGVHYALSIDQAVEIVRDPQITPVPGLPHWVLGVTNLHGDILSVVDLGEFLQMRQEADRRVQKMIVAQVADQRIGLIVDTVDIIYSLPLDQIISPPFEVVPELASYLRGAAEYQQSFVRLLDGERLLTGPEMQQFQ